MPRSLLSPLLRTLAILPLLGAAPLFADTYEYSYTKHYLSDTTPYTFSNLTFDLTTAAIINPQAGFFDPAAACTQFNLSFSCVVIIDAAAPNNPFGPTVINVRQAPGDPTLSPIPGVGLGLYTTNGLTSADFYPGTYTVDYNFLSYDVPITETDTLTVTDLGTGGTAVTPEPATFLLMLPGAFVALLRKRRV